jgi:hypothetical protein
LNLFDFGLSHHLFTTIYMYIYIGVLVLFSFNFLY